VPEERGTQQSTRGVLRVFQSGNIISPDMFVEESVNSRLHLERYLTGVVIVCGISAIICVIMTFGWESQIDRLMRTIVAVDIFALIGGGWLAYQSGRITRKMRSMYMQIVSEAAHEIESETLLRALEVFGSSDRAIEWMRQENPALGNQPPIRVIQTETGRKAVRDVLGRIEHGVIS
jgi:Protein of unknown function (DUF2384)